MERRPREGVPQPPADPGTLDLDHLEPGRSDPLDVGAASDTVSDVEATLQRALDLGDEGDWGGMADVLREGLEEHDHDAFLLCWLGVAERELGMEGVAYDHFKECLAQEPQDPYVLATAGNAVAAFDDPEAEAALRTAAMTAPELPLARWMYGAYLAREGLLDKALEELRAARSLDPEDATVAYELGVALALSDEMGGAVEELARAVELDREDGWTRIVLGLVLVELDNVEDAVPELEEGARLRPEDVEAQLLSALVLAVEGWDDRAWEMLERARIRGEGADLQLATRVEEAINRGSDASEDLLRTTLAPGALRERLMVRP